MWMRLLTFLLPGQACLDTVCSQLVPGTFLRKAQTAAEPKASAYYIRFPKPTINTISYPWNKWCLCVLKATAVDEHHKFCQLGKRLRETSRTLHRSFTRAGCHVWVWKRQTKLFEISLQRETITPRVREGLLLESDLTLQRLEPLLVNWVSNGRSENNKSGYSKHCSSCAAVPEGGLKRSLWKITILQTHAQQTPNTQGKLCYRCVSTQYIGNYARCPAREIQCKHCMKLDILWEYVLVLQMSNRYVKLLVPEVPVMSADRNSPRFTAHIATYTVNVAAVSGEPQATELMPVMSSAVSIQPKSAYLQKHWNFASYRPEVTPSELAMALSSSAWLPARKYDFGFCSCWARCCIYQQC